MLRELKAEEIKNVAGGAGNPCAPGADGTTPYVSHGSYFARPGTNPSQSFQSFRAY
jgi:hypothetical protein